MLLIQNGTRIAGWVDSRLGWRVGAVAALVAALSAPGVAQTYSSSNSSASFQNALKLLDGRASEQYAGSRRYTPQADETIPRFRGGYKGEYLPVARDVARQHGIPEDLFLRLIQQESGWNPTAVSHKGAIGLAQLMPETAARLGVDPDDPRQNLEGGARYLAQQYKRFKSWRLALAAYNAGPEAVAKYEGVPPYEETEGYVLAILGS